MTAQGTSPTLMDDEMTLSHEIIVLDFNDPESAGQRSTDEPADSVSLRGIINIINFLQKYYGMVPNKLMFWGDQLR